MGNFINYEDYEEYDVIRPRKNKNNKKNTKNNENKKIKPKDKDGISRKIILNVSMLTDPEVNSYYENIDGKSQNNELKSLEETNGFKCNGILSLETITKYVIYKLAKEGKAVDEIIMIESGAAKEKKIPNSIWGDCNATEVYQHRIKGYLGEDSEQNKKYDRYIEENNKDINGNKFICDESKIVNEIRRCYRLNNYKFPEFKVISFENGDDIAELMQLKDGLISGVDSSLELYVDTKGGTRNWIFQLDAIIGMIKDKLLKRERYETGYYRGKPIPIHPILSAEPFFEMHDLLNAYNLYKNYGIGDELYEFFKRDEDVKELAGLYKDAMDAIAICNIDKLVEKLRCIETFKNDNKEKIENSKFRLIINELYLDTKDILLNDNPMYRFVAMIEWCKNKKLYTQALNIIESNLIKHLCKENYKNEVSIDTPGNLFTIRNGGALRELEAKDYDRFNDSVVEAARKNNLTLLEFLLRQSTLSLVSKIHNYKRRKNDIEALEIDESENDEEFLSFKFDEYTTIEDMERYFLDNFDFSVAGKKELLGSFKIRTEVNIYNYDYVISSDKKKTFVMISYLYQYIKKKRNHIDHVNTDKIVDNSVELKRAIELLVEELHKL